MRILDLSAWWRKNHWITNYLHEIQFNNNGKSFTFFYYYFLIIIITTISFWVLTQLQLSAAEQKKCFPRWKMQHANGKAHKIKMISGHDVTRLSFWLRKKTILTAAQKCLCRIFIHQQQKCWCHGNSMIQKCKCTLCEEHHVVFLASVFTHKKLKLLIIYELHKFKRKKLPWSAFFCCFAAFTLGHQQSVE